MAYQKYKDNPNRREPLGGRDHIQHIETNLSRVVPGPGEVIVGGADGPVRGSVAGTYEPLDIWDAFHKDGTSGPGWLSDTYANWIAGINTHFQRELSSGTVTRQDHGASSNGEHVYSYRAGNPDGVTFLMVAGTHGEQIGIHAALRFFEQFVRSNHPQMQRLRQAFRVIYVPNVTPFVHAGGRVNANGVNINRNYDFAWSEFTPTDPVGDNKGTAPFSEPESQIVRDIVLAEKPTIFIDAHNQGTSTGNTFVPMNVSPWVLAPRMFFMHFMATMRNVYGDNGALTVEDVAGQSDRLPYAADWFMHQARWVHGDVGATASTFEAGVDLYGSNKATHTSRKAMQVYSGGIALFLAMWLEHRANIQPMPYAYEMSMRRPTVDATTEIQNGGSLIMNTMANPLWFTQSDPGLIGTSRNVMLIPAIYPKAMIVLEASGAITTPADATQAGKIQVFFRVDGATQASSTRDISYPATPGYSIPFTTATTFAVNDLTPAKRYSADLVFYRASGPGGVVIQRVVMTARVTPNTNEAQSFRVF